MNIMGITKPNGRKRLQRGIRQSISPFFLLVFSFFFCSDNDLVVISLDVEKYCMLPHYQFIRENCQTKFMVGESVW